MVFASLRLGFLLAAFAAWLDVAAAPRGWTLSGVQFADGEVATGYVTYDDVTHATINWNVRVSGGAGMFLPFTYISGNSASLPAVPFPGPRLCIYSDLNPPQLCRSIGIALLAPLDGSNAPVSIDVTTTGDVRRAFSEFFEDFEGAPAGPERASAAGSLVLTTLPPPATIVQVDEFHHPDLRHYFLTADAADKRSSIPASIPEGSALGHRSRLTPRGAVPSEPTAHTSAAASCRRLVRHAASTRLTLVNIVPTQ